MWWRKLELAWKRKTLLRRALTIDWLEKQKGAKSATGRNSKNVYDLWRWSNLLGFSIKPAGIFCAFWSIWTSVTNSRVESALWLRRRKAERFPQYGFDVRSLAQALSLVCRWTQEIGYGFQSLWRICWSLDRRSSAIRMEKRAWVDSLWKFRGRWYDYDSIRNNKGEIRVLSLAGALYFDNTVYHSEALSRRFAQS